MAESLIVQKIKAAKKLKSKSRPKTIPIPNPISPFPALNENADAFLRILVEDPRFNFIFGQGSFVRRESSGPIPETSTPEKKQEMPTVNAAKLPPLSPLPPLLTLPPLPTEPVLPIPEITEKPTSKKIGDDKAKCFEGRNGEDKKDRENGTDGKIPATVVHEGTESRTKETEKDDNGNAIDELQLVNKGEQDQEQEQGVKEKEKGKGKEKQKQKQTAHPEAKGNRNENVNVSESENSAVGNKAADNGDNGNLNLIGNAIANVNANANANATDNEKDNDVFNNGEQLVDDADEDYWNEDDFKDYETFGENDEQEGEEEEDYEDDYNANYNNEDDDNEEEEEINEDEMFWNDDHEFNAYHQYLPDDENERLGDEAAQNGAYFENLNISNASDNGGRNVNQTRNSADNDDLRQSNSVTPCLNTSQASAFPEWTENGHPVIDLTFENYSSSSNNNNNNSNNDNVAGSNNTINNNNHHNQQQLQQQLQQQPQQQQQQQQQQLQQLNHQNHYQSFNESEYNVMDYYNENDFDFVYFNRDEEHSDVDADTTNDYQYRNGMTIEEMAKYMT